MQYFGLEPVDEGTERTYWTHKPNIWQNCFESIQGFSKTGTVTPISEMFNGVLSCPVRVIPKGSNDTKTFQSVKGQEIQHWILLVPMPADVDFTSFIQDFLSSFQSS